MPRILCNGYVYMKMDYTAFFGTIVGMLLILYSVTTVGFSSVLILEN